MHPSPLGIPCDNDGFVTLHGSPQGHESGGLIAVRDHDAVRLSVHSRGVFAALYNYSMRKATSEEGLERSTVQTAPFSLFPPQFTSSPSLVLGSQHTSNIKRCHSASVSGLCASEGEKLKLLPTSTVPKQALRFIHPPHCLKSEGRFSLSLSHAYSEGRSSCTRSLSLARSLARSLSHSPLSTIHSTSFQPPPSHSPRFSTLPSASQPSISISTDFQVAPLFFLGLSRSLDSFD
mmetsp:Transcript_31471/g.67594  ORF Transcript_31471/g.67594 Transcript_31471/m.67594 type:complete len:234 (-) Transcript_31471:148-849(-)